MSETKFNAHTKPAKSREKLALIKQPKVVEGPSF
jgi:hypothetical protein